MQSFKFLLSPHYCRNIIGHDAVVLENIRTVSKANVSVGAPRHTYPGTIDRVVLISGHNTAIKNAITLICRLARHLNLSKGAANTPLIMTEKDLELEEEDEAEYTLHIRALIPISSVGCIMGKGGALLRSVTEMHKAITVLGTPQSGQLTSERILNVNASFKNAVSFLHSIFDIMTTEPNTIVYRYGLNYASTNAPSPILDACPMLFSLELDGGSIGSILGRNGQAMAEIMSTTGVSILINRQEKYFSPEERRKIQISGLPNQCHDAFGHIVQRMMNPPNHNNRGLSTRYLVLRLKHQIESQTKQLHSLQHLMNDLQQQLNEEEST